MIPCCKLGVDIVKKPRLIIDSDTGEITGALESGDRIVRKNSIDNYQEKQKAPNNETFSKLYHGSIPELSECKMTASEYKVFIFLSTHLRYQSNVAKFSNGKPITRQNIQTIVKIKDITIKRTIAGLIRHGLIVEVTSKEGKVFVVNPFVVSVGDSISKTIYDLFRKTKWARW
jgi:predicted HTH transcriptional regulator